MTRSETAGGGVVYRRSAGGVEIVVAEQHDRLSLAPTTRLPKGKVDPGETPEQTAVREVEEETVLSSSVVAPLGPVHYS